MSISLYSGPLNPVDKHLVDKAKSFADEHLKPDAEQWEQAKQQPTSDASQPITGERVAQLAEQGNELARQVMIQAGQALGVAVASLAMILDIELYVIGGSVVKAGDLLLEPARQTMPKYCFQSVASKVQIVPVGLGDDGPLLGCG